MSHANRHSSRRALPVKGDAKVARVAALALLLCAGSAVFAQTVVPPGAQAATPMMPVPAASVMPAAPVFIDGPSVIMPVLSRREMARMAPVQLKNVDVRVAIDNQVATTSLELTLTNLTSTPREAQVVIPVPDGVSVRSFQYDGTGPEPTATIVAVDEARRYYESVVARMRDPGMLEFAGMNMIKSSVFPIPAGQTQKVRIIYEQVLTPVGDRVDFVLPRSESLQGGAQWAVTLSIKADRAITTLFSPTHALAQTRTGPNEISARVEAGSLTQPGSMTVSYLLQPRSGDGPAASLVAFPDPSVGDGKGGFFMLLVGLPPEQKSAKVQARDLTIVIDRSGSMRGEKIQQAKAAALQVVQGLNDGESFNVIDYSDSISSFAAGGVRKDAATAQRAMDYIKAIEANGGTNLDGALQEALRTKPSEGALPLVLFMTDGQPTVGERSEGVIRANAVKANTFQRRVFTFGVGYDVNSPLLSAVAAASRGAPTFVMPSEDVEVKVGQVFKRLAGPVLTAPRLAATGDVTLSEMVPATLADVFDGDQILVVGRYSAPGPISVRLTGAQGAKERTFDFNLSSADASARNGYVARLWAQRRIATLIDSIRQARGDTTAPTNDPATKELVDEIVRLSTKFGILTEYTAFLAKEKDAAFTRERFAAAPAAVSESLARRAADRDGAGSVNQESNLGAMSAAPRESAKKAVLENRQTYLADDMTRRELTNVQTVNDRAFVQRNNRWIDMRMLALESEQPQQIVEFGTPEYFAVARKLSASNLAGALSLDGEVYLMVENQRVLVRNTVR
ncbi:hypothetical protein BH11PLA1_BH11PLA1_04340 [soil metagenome]